MAPYRSAREPRAAPAAPEQGLVADMVRQFADPYAFLRELVQNGMDAGARRIAVCVELMPGGVSAISVSDDGCGMTREGIEGPLLTLFISSKEGDEGKIGKYGVGFVSVFALGPIGVEVETWRDGRAWHLRLQPDYSYELEDAGGREGSGTRVTLLQKMDRDGFPAHAARAGAALRRWCRHAECEIELRVVDLDAPAELSAQGGAPDVERIDTPLSVAAAVSVTLTADDLTVIVGPSAGAARLAPGPPGGAEEAAGGPRPGAPTADEPDAGPRFAGFYNRGLTLFETADEVFEGLSGVRFKVMSRRFQHTLSRDNVRRDEAFREALSRVREAVKGPLRRELAARLGPAAAAAAEGRDVKRFIALLEAALTPPTELDRDEIPFPLAHPIQGASARADLGAIVPRGEPLLTAGLKTALSEAVSRSGRPVVLCKHDEIRALLRRCYPKRRVAAVRAEFVLVRGAQSEPGEADTALGGAVGEALARAGREVSRIAFCQILGAHGKRAAILVADEGQEGPWLCSALEVEQRARRWRPTDALHLNVRSGTVAVARRRAAADPIAAGALLARALLVEARGPLDAGDSDRLLDLGQAGAARPARRARS